jgi:DNA invertase Pin-like site-specific DNA recombinase
MSKEKNLIKYFIYVRKSTEGDEKQALSIDSQKDKAKEMFGHLSVVDVLEERKSAFTPYNRTVFADMIQRIEHGEAQGIISWHPDRLSRNEIDGASITYMIRQGKIKDLRFGSYSFDNSPEGIMMLQMALTQSQYSSAKLSKDVKRGLEKKLRMGWMPGVSPSGYMNNKTAEKGEREIKKDPFGIRSEPDHKRWKTLYSSQ